MGGGWRGGGSPLTRSSKVFVGVSGFPDAGCWTLGKPSAACFLTQSKQEAWSVCNTPPRPPPEPCGVLWRSPPSNHRDIQLFRRRLFQSWREQQSVDVGTGVTARTAPLITRTRRRRRRRHDKGAAPLSCDEGIKFCRSLFLLPVTV